MQFATFNISRNPALPDATIVSSFRTARILRRRLALTDIIIEHDLDCEDHQLVVSASLFEYLADCVRKQQQSENVGGPTAS